MTRPLKQKPYAAESAKVELQVSSPDFGYMQPIPRQYTCDGADINPQLDLGNIPPGTVSLAIMMVDKDHGLENFVHWVIWNIPVAGTVREVRVAGVTGTNDHHQRSYRGPCPQYGIHRYFFKVYALDTLLDLSPQTDGRNLERAMAGHILGFGKIAGTYRRK